MESSECQSKCLLALGSFALRAQKIRSVGLLRVRQSEEIALRASEPKSGRAI